MLLLTSLQVTYPTAPSGGLWYLMNAPGLINLRVNSVCGAYTLGQQVGTTANPEVEFDCTPTPGLYTFEYRVTSCSTPLVYGLKVNYTQDFSAAIEAIYSGTPCEIFPIIIDVDSAAQAVSALWAADSYTPTINGRLGITDSCSHSATYPFSIASQSKVHAVCSVAVTDYSGYIKTVRLRNSTTVFNIDVSPTSAYLSYTGSPWVVDGNDLYFSVANANWNTYKNAVQNVILNAVHSLTGSQTNMCPFGLTWATNSSGQFFVNLDFISKHQPSATFTGLAHDNVNIVSRQGGSDVTLTTTTRYLIVNEALISVTGAAYCGNIITVTNTLEPHTCTSTSPQAIQLVANGVSGMNVSYNNIVLGGNRLDTYACAITGSLTCGGTTLSIKAIPTPSCPNATYLWSNAATTQTLTSPASGNYTVTVTCDSCSAAASITV